MTLEYNVNGSYSRHVFGNKEVYVFEEHHYALPIWGKKASELNRPLTLITFDTHTDTQEPFLRYIVKNSKEIKCGDIDQNHPIVKEFCNRPNVGISDFQFDEAYKLVQFLCNDEHIKTAVALHYISKYLVLNRRNNYESRDRSSGYDANYYIVKGKTRILFNSNILKKVLNDTRTENTIVDIDLDFFTGRPNLSEVKTRQFRDIIRQATVITIAREQFFFDQINRDRTFTNAMAEDAILKIISECSVPAP